ncbi:MAG: hypothetical protein IMZ44_17325 [Planctomycetes bacterium]|nr:hypothetical protein [Planctomycetota bacterium]
MRVTIRVMEAYLRESGTPYVAVDEAKKALFAGVQLRSFDFVAYSESGPNWLITCKPFSQGDMREVMRKWEDVFGKGFAAAEVRLRKGRFVLVTLDGKATELLPVELPQGFRPGDVLHHRKAVKEFDREQAAPPDAAPPQQPEPVRPERTLFEVEGGDS